MASQAVSGDNPSRARVSKLARRPHHKSRNGCFNCKRRKVKCDEVKPACANCVRFGITCDFAPRPVDRSDGTSQNSSPEAIPNHVGESQTPRRGPGRPRKDWAALTRPPPPSSEGTASSPPSAGTAAAASPPALSSSSSCSINVADAELLYHFIHHTTTTLHDSPDPKASIHVFWSLNVPRIGFVHHYVLHLAYAIAGYHLAFLEPKGTERHVQNLQLAAYHQEIGLAELSKTLLNLSEENCGALYTSTLLVCYCAFASGPTGKNDILVCTVDQDVSPRWLPLIHGVRLIRQTFDPATLFTGLTSPLGQGADPHVDDGKPAYKQSGLPHIDWLEPLQKLRTWVESHQTLDSIMYERTLKILFDIWEANYGNAEGTFEGPPHSKFVFGWLYSLQDQFVESLKRKEPRALLILAYYVPLFNTIRRGWFMNGWAVHIIEAIYPMLAEDLRGWLEWPMEVSRKYAPREYNGL